MLIVGTGNFAKDILPSVSKDVEDIVFYDLMGKSFEGFYAYPCLNTEVELTAYLQASPEFIVAVGDPLKRRKMTQEMEALGGVNVNYISSQAMLGKSVKLGKKGVIILAMTYISEDVSIDEGVIVYAHCGIGHGCRIGAYSMLSAYTCMSSATIGKDTYVGIGANFKPGVIIGNNCFVGIGSVVTKDFPDNSHIIGVPARKMKSL